MTKTLVSLVFLVLLAGAAMLCLPPMMQALRQATAGTGVIAGSHATAKHIEAQDVRNCLDKNGPYMVFKDKFEPSWYLICQLENGLWGMQVVTKDGYEKSAYSRGDGSWEVLMKHLNRVATRFTKTLPWLH